MNDTIRTLISQYEEPGDFTYAKVTDIELELAEKELKLTLPIEYVEFLKSYGHGGICGCCTDGIGLDGSYIFVENTLEYRAEGLPKNYIVIENADEWLYCIDANTGKIMSWDLSNPLFFERLHLRSFLTESISQYNHLQELPPAVPYGCLAKESAAIRDHLPLTAALFNNIHFRFSQFNLMT